MATVDDLLVELAAETDLGPPGPAFWNDYLPRCLAEHERLAPDDPDAFVLELIGLLLFEVITIDQLRALLPGVKT